MEEQVDRRTPCDDSGQVVRALAEGESRVVTMDDRSLDELGRRHSVPVGVAQAVFTTAPPVDRHSFIHDVDEVLDQDVEPRA